MGDHGGHVTAFQRINQFNDSKTEMVWDIFRDELRRAATAEDGEKTLYGLELWPAATLTVAPVGLDVETFYKKMGWGYQ